MKQDDLQYSDDLLFTIKHEQHVVQNILLYLMITFIVLFFIFILLLWMTILQHSIVIPIIQSLNGWAQHQMSL